jgi:DNA-binding response OmpR family regulator
MLTLIVEPNSQLTVPYELVQEHYTHKLKIVRCMSIEEALKELDRITPDLVLLSTAFSPHKTLQLLEKLKSQMTTRIIPLIFVVDFSQRIHRLLGTSWAGKVGILHTFSSQAEVDATCSRLT